MYSGIGVVQTKTEVLMKQIKDTVSGKLLNVYRILLLIIMILIVIVISGGILAILRSPESGPLFRLGKAASKTEAGSYLAAELSVFNGIGRLRIPVTRGDSSPATMIISIAFPYPSDDRPYTEELASKIYNFRTITNDYFSSLPASAIANFNEENAKTELLKRYNEILRLGKIDVLYFNDLMILE